MFRENKGSSVLSKFLDLAANKLATATMAIMAIYISASTPTPVTAQELVPYRGRVAVDGLGYPSLYGVAENSNTTTSTLFSLEENEILVSDLPLRKKRLSLLDTNTNGVPDLLHTFEGNLMTVPVVQSELPIGVPQVYNNFTFPVGGGIDNRSWAFDLDGDGIDEHISSTSKETVNPGSNPGGCGNILTLSYSAVMLQFTESASGAQRLLADLPFVDIYNIATADLNGDGIKEIVVSGRSAFVSFQCPYPCACNWNITIGQRFFILSRDSGGTYSVTSDVTWTTSTNKEAIYSPLFRDVNGDGLTDITFFAGGLTVRSFHNLGLGNFTSDAMIEYPVSCAPLNACGSPDVYMPLPFLDVDDKPGDELVLGMQYSNSSANIQDLYLGIFKLNALGKFELSQWYGPLFESTPNSAGSFYSLTERTPIDIDGDGFKDIILRRTIPGGSSEEYSKAYVVFMGGSSAESVGYNIIDLDPSVSRSEPFFLFRKEALKGVKVTVGGKSTFTDNFGYYEIFAPPGLPVSMSKQNFSITMQATEVNSVGMRLTNAFGVYVPPPPPPTPTPTVATPTPPPGSQNPNPGGSNPGSGGGAGGGVPNGAKVTSIKVGANAKKRTVGVTLTWPQGVSNNKNSCKWEIRAGLSKTKPALSAIAVVGSVPATVSKFSLQNIAPLQTDKKGGMHVGAQLKCGSSIVAVAEPVAVKTAKKGLKTSAWVKRVKAELKKVGAKKGKGKK